MNIKLRNFTKLENERLDALYKQDPLYNIQLRYISSYSNHKGILTEQQIWFLAKRMYLYHADNTDINKGITSEYKKALYEAIYGYTIETGRFVEDHEGYIGNDEDDMIQCVLNTIIVQAYCMGYVMEDDDFCEEIYNNSDIDLLETINNAKTIIEMGNLVDKCYIDYTKIQTVFEFSLYSFFGDRFSNLRSFDFKERLKYYKQHPVFMLYYKDTNKALCDIYKYRNQHIDINAIIYLFDEVDFLVGKITEDEDFVAENLQTVLSNLIMESEAMKEVSPGIRTSMYDQEVKILELMLVMIVAFKSMGNVIDDAMEVFKSTRTYCQYHSQLWKHYEQRPLWDKMCEIVPDEDNPSISELQSKVKNTLAELQEKDRQLAEKDNLLQKKDQQIEDHIVGWYEDDKGNKKVHDTPTKVAILFHLLDFTEPFTREQRTEFKKLCKFFTNAEDSTLERVISDNELRKRQENYSVITSRFPILNQ